MKRSRRLTCLGAAAGPDKGGKGAGVGGGRTEWGEGRARLDGVLVRLDGAVWSGLKLDWVYGVAGWIGGMGGIAVT